MKDGTITVTETSGEEFGTGGDIVTTRAYSDFELSADFETSPGANSGKGLSMLFSQRTRCAMAAACDSSFLATSCGYMGASDACTRLAKFEELPDANAADNGNIATAGEIDWKQNSGVFTVSIACGSDPAEAAQQARAGILEEFDKTRTLFLQHWSEQQAQYANL